MTPPLVASCHHYPRKSLYSRNCGCSTKHGKKRRYLAASKEELYSGRPDLAENCSHQLRSGWWLGTNASKAAIEKLIQMACDVAGVTYGQELVIELG
jgi:predicted type IV restriction endonuclease